MSTRRELEAIRRRLNAIVPIISPPELKINVITGSDAVPAPSPWAMTIYIESKKQTLGH